ncbi:MAG TPA: hypothetical protein VN611_10300 [Patescibacteria group bacterium]|nr:hypothetical protein [Patescibacteria group bacterium]
MFNITGVPAVTMFKVTGVPGVNPVRRIRRIDLLDRDDQKHSDEYTPPKKTFKAVLNKQLKSSPPGKDSVLNIGV